MIKSIFVNSWWLLPATVFSIFWGTYGWYYEKEEYKLDYNNKDDKVFGIGAVVSEFVGSFAGWCCLHILAVRLFSSYVTFVSADIFLAIGAVVGIAGYSYRIAELVGKFGKEKIE